MSARGPGTLSKQPLACPAFGPILGSSRLLGPLPELLLDFSHLLRLLFQLLVGHLLRPATCSNSALSPASFTRCSIGFFFSSAELSHPMTFFAAPQELSPPAPRAHGGRRLAEEAYRSDN